MMSWDDCLVIENIVIEISKMYLTVCKKKKVIVLRFIAMVYEMIMLDEKQMSFRDALMMKK